MSRDLAFCISSSMKVRRSDFSRAETAPFEEDRVSLSSSLFCWDWRLFLLGDGFRFGVDTAA